MLPGLVGCLLANEAIKLITGAGPVLSGKLLVLDALRLDFNTFTFSLNPENKKIRSLPGQDLSCPADIRELPASAVIAMLAQGQGLTLLDVREAAEYEAGNIGAALLPLGLVAQHLAVIPKELPVVVHCQSGLRSRKAARILAAAGYQPVWNLRGGLAGLASGEAEALRALLQSKTQIASPA